MFSFIYILDSYKQQPPLINGINLEKLGEDEK
jgi:hypothetical protein